MKIYTALYKGHHTATLSTVVCIVIAMTLCACRHQTAQSVSAGGDTLVMHHARLLTLVKHDHYTEAVIANPWKPGTILHRYYLVAHTDSGRFTPPTGNGDIVYTPVRRSVVALSSLCQLATWLKAEQRIKGVCDCQYIHVPRIRQLLSRHYMADCGSSMSPNIEAIAGINADAVFLSPFENATYGRTGQMGIPVIECAEYMEKTALGRAEWMKFYGMLFGKSAQAEALFRTVENRYKAIRAEAYKAKTRPGVLTERVMSGTWYCPGGKSTMASMIEDANGQYIFFTDRHSGSVPLAPETVIAHGSKADVWFFVATGSQPMSRTQLLSEYHGYSQIKAFATGRVYQCANLSSAYFDELSFRPDYVLQDMTWMFHPELNNGHPLRYFVQ